MESDVDATQPPRVHRCNWCKNAQGIFLFTYLQNFTMHYNLKNSVFIKIIYILARKVAWSGRSFSLPRDSAEEDRRKTVGPSENQATRKEAPIACQNTNVSYFSSSIFSFERLAQDGRSGERTILVTCSRCLNKRYTFFRAALHDPWSGDPRTIPVSANQASVPATLEVSLVQKLLLSLHFVCERGGGTWSTCSQVNSQSYDPVCVEIFLRVVAFLPIMWLSPNWPELLVPFSQKSARETDSRWLRSE